MAATRHIAILRKGLIRYGAALAMQEEAASLCKAGKVPSTLFICQHHPVYTVGKRQTVHNILATPETLSRIGAEVFHIGRGGDVTFHGPGQVVMYPILDLHKLKLGARRYVEGLEDVMVNTAAHYGIKARGRVSLQTGVWVEDRKIGAVGVKISSGITSHGLAFNVNPDLDYFEHIVPCGIRDKVVTSLQKEKGREGEIVDTEEVTEKLIESFLDVFEMTPG